MNLFPDIFQGNSISNTIADRILFLEIEMKDYSFKLEGWKDQSYFTKLKSCSGVCAGPSSHCDTAAPLGREEITSHTFSK